MKTRYHWLHQSQYLPPLSPACEMCAKGSKMVVLITGLCPAHCFYCPLSKLKQQKDVIYADEWKLKNEEDKETLIAEARAIDASGAGITGGDPLLVPNRTIEYIKFLKQTFGKNFHIHLYTSGLKNIDSIEHMVNNGLDEIRFHPEPKYWNKMHKSPLQTAMTNIEELSVDIAIEIPVIPGKKQKIIELIKWSDQLNINYVNLNELEFSEQNETALYQRGCITKNDISAAAKGSQETAMDVLNHFETHNVNIGVHYCSSSFKDGVQLRNRMIRRAQHITTDLTIITEDGTILKGIIEPTQSQPISTIESILIKKLCLSKHKYFINREQHRVELHPDLLTKHAAILNSLDVKCFVIEEYPTADRLEVERIPVI